MDLEINAYMYINTGSCYTVGDMIAISHNNVYYWRTKHWYWFDRHRLLKLIKNEKATRIILKNKDDIVGYPNYLYRFDEKHLKNRKGITWCIDTTKI